MLRSMTGFGRCFLEDTIQTQVWEVRSVNGRYLDIRWRLAHQARSFETAFEKLVKRYASRGRLEISLDLRTNLVDEVDSGFNEDQATAMLDRLEAFAGSRGNIYTPDYNALLSLPFLWRTDQEELDDEALGAFEKGLSLALEDWNESREQEAKTLATDLSTRFLRIEEWVALIEKRSPSIKEERFEVIRERLDLLLQKVGQEIDDARFMQEIAIIADKLDVTEELTRLGAHMSRLRELLLQGKDAGKKMDFTLQECFREITTCGNKIQDLQVSRLVVDIKTELEKCREQVQNLE